MKRNVIIDIIDIKESPTHKIRKILSINMKLEDQFMAALHQSQKTLTFGLKLPTQVKIYSLNFGKVQEFLFNGISSTYH